MAALPLIIFSAISSYEGLGKIHLASCTHLSRGVGDEEKIKKVCVGEKGKRKDREL